MQIPAHCHKTGKDAEANAEGEHNEEEFGQVEREVVEEAEFGDEESELG